MTLLAGFKNVCIHSGNRKEHLLENRNFIKELTVFSKFKGKEAETGPRVLWASWAPPLPSSPRPPSQDTLVPVSERCGPKLMRTPQCWRQACTSGALSRAAGAAECCVISSVWKTCSL